MSLINNVIADRYILKELIGQGGMADVYLAEDPILKRTVAVKIMRSSLTGDPVYVTRFHREASAAASLIHKNIVEIYDVGQDNDNYYIVMEYVPGQTLKELIHKRGALHFVEAVDIMQQVTSATAKAHSLGIIHRDLKPQNIMVTDSGVVKIGDFGIASIQSLSQVTQADTIMGSLHYLAPEIARGEKATIQSDVYALGIVFYELLRGDVPFNGESPVNIALKHMRDDIPSVREFNPTIPQSVENVIIKATAKNIKDRYQKADDMLKDLLTCLSRDNEEKLVFRYEDEQAPTIVADDKNFFTKDVKEIKKVEEPKEKKPMDKKKVMAITGGVVAGVLLLFALIYFVFLKPTPNFRMPDVIGLKQEEAIAILEDKGLVIDENVETQLSDDFEEGQVLDTDPTNGTAVRKGDKVKLIVSSGKYIVMNHYVGQTYNDVKKELEELGFIVIKEEDESEEEKDVILKQSITEGEKLDPAEVNGMRIVLTVSKGYEVTVPNVISLQVDTAKQQLEELGFKVNLKALPAPTTTEEISTMKINVVMTQSIDAFKVIKKKGTSITLGYYDKKPALPKPVEPTAPVEPTTPDEPTDNQE